MEGRVLQGIGTQPGILIHPAPYRPTAVVAYTKDYHSTPTTDYIGY